MPERREELEGVAGQTHQPWMADPDPAVRHLVRHMPATAAGRPGLHLFITPDFVITVTPLC